MAACARCAKPAIGPIALLEDTENEIAESLQKKFSVFFLYVQLFLQFMGDSDILIL